MKVKHIISTCGIILGGVAATSGASAVVTYKDSAEVQFSFSSTLSMTLSADGFTISNLTPGTSSISNSVTASVSTNNPSGYLLSATVGNSTYNTTDLVSTNGQKIEMMGSGTALSSGTWGYTINNGTTYGALSNVSPTTLAKTTAAGAGTTEMKIGAYAAGDQHPGTYNNVVNFSVISNIATHTVDVTGSNTSSVSPSAPDSYAEGAEIDISATCASGYTFANWGKSGDYGMIADPSSATTTYTVGAGNATLTAYCVNDD